MQNDLSMIRILHISPSISVKGGISALLQYYLKTNLPHQYDLFFVTSHMDGAKLYKFYVAFVGLLRMLLLMLRARIDIVHIHCGDTMSHYRKYLYFRIAQCFGKKIILHLHGALFIEQFKHTPPFWRRRLEKFFEESHLVICLGKNWSHEIGLLFPRSNRIVIPNGIPMPKINCKLNDRRKEVTVTFLGLIGSRKGIFDLLTVVKELVDQGLPIHFKIGGNGEVERLQKAIKVAQLKDHVEYIGWVSHQEKEHLLQETDIYVLPSYGEGMPMSILEAMSYSIPIISTWVGGIPEVVTNGSSGFLVHPGDTAELSSKLRLLIEDASLRNNMGENARKAVEAFYDIELIAQRVGDIYNRLFSQVGLQKWGDGAN